MEHDVFDVAAYHKTFMTALLLLARALSRVLLLKPERVSSNKAAFLLAGAAGSGKSILVQMLERYVGGYRWCSTSKF